MRLSLLQVELYTSVWIVLAISSISLEIAPMVWWLAYWLHNPLVQGSIPWRGSTFFLYEIVLSFYSNPDFYIWQSGHLLAVEGFDKPFEFISFGEVSPTETNSEHS